jgi:hypothetical protein
LRTGPAAPEHWQDIRGLDLHQSGDTRFVTRDWRNARDDLQGNYLPPVRSSRYYNSAFEMVRLAYILWAKGSGTGRG